MKKKLLFLLATLFFAHCSFAQGDFAPIGAKWYYSLSYAMDLRLGFTEQVVTKDTTIDGQICRKIERTEVVKRGDISNSPTDTNTLESLYVYSNTDTVFYYNTIFEKFLPLYIYNVAVGDTISYHVPDTNWLSVLTDSIFRMKVTRVSQQQFGGETLKYISISLIDEYYSYGGVIHSGDGYYEKIGSTNWLLHNNTARVSTTPSFLRCYSDATLSYVLDAEIPCDYVDGPTSINGRQLKDRNISVYPNPAQDYINIKADGINLKDAEIHIYDAVGKKVNASIANGKIDVSALAQGMYLLKLVVGNDNLVKKVLIN